MSENTTKISEYINENFGANASYVEGLLARYKADPATVDESWQTFFSEMLAGNGQVVHAETHPVASVPAASEAETRPVGSVPLAKPTESKIPETSESKPLIGAAKKIVENMEQSLTVPTATSVRTMPVKLLDENRKIINQHLAIRGGGKASFTHLIAWAIVKAAKEYPAMNNGYGVVDGKPSRIENESINLGIAIDIQKKDGSRNLLVPNIKGCEKMTFSQFFAAYNDTVHKARDGKLEIPDFG